MPKAEDITGQLGRLGKIGTSAQTAAAPKSCFRERRLAVNWVGGIGLFAVATGIGLQAVALYWIAFHA
jgi:hypothetical protein